MAIHKTMLWDNSLCIPGYSNLSGSMEKIVLPINPKIMGKIESGRRINNDFKGARLNAAKKQVIPASW